MHDAAPGPLAIDAELAAKTSFAAEQNAVPVLRRLHIANTGEVPVERVVAEIAANPPVFQPRQWHIDRIAPRSDIRLPDRDLRLDGAYLQRLQEAVRTTVTVRVRTGDADGPAVAEGTFPLDVLASTEWGGIGEQADLLAAFVQPNDPAVARILKRAADFLRRAGLPDGINGYQSGSKARAYDLASAIWSAVAAEKITYAEPPASFEAHGQKIRTPTAILTTRLATCLDTALLFAAALEQAGLYPVIVVVREHAFAGVWLQPQPFASMQVAEPATLRKRADLNELVLFETTLVTASPPVGFRQAAAVGRARLAEANDAAFIAAIDIFCSRKQHVRALALDTAPTGGAQGDAPADGSSAAAPGPTFDPAPALGGFDLIDRVSEPGTPEGRLERWQRKLLDLTTRNRLLNVVPGPNAIPLLCPDPASVEDRLAAGVAFRITALPRFDGPSGRDTALIEQRTREAADTAYAREVLERDQLVSPLDEEKLDARLTELYRKARLDLAEGGANTLFLALGTLVWRKSPQDAKAYRAPLILVPVLLERGSARSGVRMRAHEEEARFNLTLLQLLRQDFALDIGELAGPLPTDGSGIDVAGVWTTMRRAVRDAPGFEVAEDVLLGAFSFAKYLMWKDLADRAEALKANPVVRHLLETPKSRYGGTGEAPRADRLDAELTPDMLYTPLPADSSQLAAVVAAGRGCDFVLDGPPGTGKSQTIANMIAHNLALGRKVLFVAEKRAALEVVHRRLVQHGLGPFCLELHSNKAAKQDVLRQLDAAWTTRDTLPEEAWSRHASDLRASRDALNRLVQALHTKHPNGLTLYQAIGRVVRDGTARAVPLAWPAGVRHDAAAMGALREAAHALDLHRIADPGDAADAFALVGRTEWSPLWQRELVDAAARLAERAEVAAKIRADYLKRLAITMAADLRGLQALVGLSRALDGAAGINLGFAFGPDAARVSEAAREAVGVLAEIGATRAGLSVPLDPAAVRAVPVAELQAEWAAATRALWLVAKRRKAAVARRLHPGHDGDVGADLTRIERLQALFGRLDALGPDLGTVPGWAGADSDAARMRRAVEAAAGLHAAIAAAATTPEQLIALRGALRLVCLDGNDLLAPDAPLGQAAAAWRDAHADYTAAWDTFARTAETPAPPDTADLLADAVRWGTALRAEERRLNGWCAWRRARLRASDLQLGPLLDAIDAGAVPAGGAAEAFELAYARWWAEVTVEAEPAVRGFNLAAHNDVLARFRDLDHRAADLTSAYIRARLSGRIPPKDAGGTSEGLNALRHQLSLKRGSLPVRRLIEKMGGELTTLAPCLLMSPLSVAQYLPADAALFDLVIFDEASQIAPWDAVGAIARGRQVVVAGDPKQMPPTSFFERGAGTVADDDDVEPDQESILDECLAAQLGRLRLTWHYRSRHESLIAFSNHTYYGNELITFPAPVTRASAVSFRQIAGSWARGAARTNATEAKAIVAEVVARLRAQQADAADAAETTLMVITLNAEQQRLIEDLLDQARRDDPSLERHFAEDLTEPVVVRNLETVQGDERDVVLLGVGYGPDTPDAPSMPMNFGPLNRAGGWRRLNVAATRARREMVVFASFPPTHIDLNRTSAAAVRDLRHFLEYAAQGPAALGAAVAGSVGGYDSPFEEAVAQALRARGWTVVPQIGVSRFRIDLGIVHPDRPGDYLAGVECDGASYHSAATARDRDRVRAQVLKDLGWTLERVWSTHWWIDRPGALDRLHDALQAHLEASRARDAAATVAKDAAGGNAPEADAPEADAPGADPLSADAPGTDALLGDLPGETGTAVPRAGGDTAARRYRVTAFDDMAVRLDPDRFHERSHDGVLRDMVARVVASEAPIRDEVLVERIARAHGIKRNGRLVRERILRVAAEVAHVATEGDRAFVWPDAEAPARWQLARAPAGDADRRPLEDIALQELAAALRVCRSDDPEAEAARLFGMQRLTPGGRERLALARTAAGGEVGPAVAAGVPPLIHDMPATTSAAARS